MSQRTLIYLFKVLYLMLSCMLWRQDWKNKNWHAYATYKVTI